MKTTNFFQTVFTLAIVLFLTSCTQENTFEQNEDTSAFKIVPYNNNKSATIYTNNYVVSDQTTQIDVANDKISLEIPVPKNDYQLLRVYNISTDNNPAILYLIGRNSTQEVAKNPVAYLIKDEISISALGLDTNLLENGNGLRIFVMNNVQEIDTDSSIYNCVADKVDETAIDNQTQCQDNNKAADGPMFVKGMIVMF